VLCGAEASTFLTWTSLLIWIFQHIAKITFIGLVGRQELDALARRTHSFHSQYLISYFFFLPMVVNVMKYLCIESCILFMMLLF